MQAQRHLRRNERPRRCPCTRPGRPHSRRSRSPRRRCRAIHVAASKTSPVPVHSARQAPLSQVSKPSSQMQAHVAASKTSPVPVHSARQAPLSQVSKPSSQMQAHVFAASKTSPGARALGQAGPTLAGLEALVADAGARRGVEDLAGARALGQAGPTLAGLEALVADAGARRGVEDLAGARALGQAGPTLAGISKPSSQMQAHVFAASKTSPVPVHSARQAPLSQVSKPIVADAGARSAASKTSPVPVHSARQAPLSQVSKPSSQMQAHVSRRRRPRRCPCTRPGRPHSLAGLEALVADAGARLAASKTSAGARALGLGRPHSRRSRSPRRRCRRTSRSSKTSPVPVHSARQAPLSQVSKPSSQMTGARRGVEDLAGARALGLGRPHSRRSRSPRRRCRRTSRPSKTSPVPVHSARQAPLSQSLEAGSALASDGRISTNLVRSTRITAAGAIARCTQRHALTTTTTESRIASEIAATTNTQPRLAISWCRRTRGASRSAGARASVGLQHVPPLGQNPELQVNPQVPPVHVRAALAYRWADRRCRSHSGRRWC